MPVLWHLLIYLIDLVKTGISDHQSLVPPEEEAGPGLPLPVLELPDNLETDVTAVLQRVEVLSLAGYLLDDWTRGSVCNGEDVSFTTFS